MNRRQWLLGAGTLLGATAAPRNAHSSRAGIQNPSSATTNDKPLPLAEYEPKSMLHTRETHTERPRYPAIDFHTHISTSNQSENGVALSPQRRYLGTPQELLAVMDRKHLQAMVNLTGGYDRGLADAVTKYDRAFPGRFYSFTEPCYSRFKEPDYPKLQADAIEQAHRDGAKGLKILKTLGLYLRENITAGTLVKIDDRRFDPMWEACGQLNIPVAIHVSDPIAFFLPTNRFNERYEELRNHPDWSFYDHDFPSNAELLEARNRVMARHPKTQFVVLHVGNFAENLENVSENLDRFPNMSVDIAARIGELGRQPRAARKFFEKYQDRIVFGTDATPHGDKFPSGALQRSNQIGNGSLPNRSPNLWFNVNDFPVPNCPNGCFGNAGKNILEGPGATTADLSARKFFDLTERVNLEFRAEFFNAFNHAVFSQPDPFITDGPGAAGVITSTVIPQRQIQFALKLHF